MQPDAHGHGGHLDQTNAAPVRMGSALTHSLASPAGLTRGSIRFAKAFGE